MKVLKVYGLVAIVIMVWWTLAFKQKPDNTSPTAPHPLLSSDLSDNNPFSLLAPISRDTLLNALAGDFPLMSALISKWDIDAQILQEYGINSISRLSAEDYLRSQIIARQLKNSTSSELAHLREKYKLKQLTDDTGKSINLNKPFQKFLPQTYVSASFLLALTSPKNIVALPKHLREQTEIYPKKLTNQIPLDIDRYNSEKLFQANPEIAFIAHYSHPATTQALANQGIVLYTMKNLATLKDIQDELLNIGSIINRPLEAELLNIFMLSAMQALDNRLQVIHFANPTPPLNTLYLYYHQNFSIPTRKTLTGQLLMRLKNPSLSASIEKDQSNAWNQPIDKEHIVNLNPACLIIATDKSNAVREVIQKDPALKRITAVQNNCLYFVDEAIQHSPSQYIVLAYYDLVQAMLHSAKSTSYNALPPHSTAEMTSLP